MPLKIRCPGCSCVSEVGEHLAGRTTTCPNCRAEIRIPAGIGSSMPKVDVTPPAPPLTKKVDDKAVAWQIVVGLGVVLMLLRKFACAPAPAVQGPGGPELQKFAKDTSNDIVLGIVVLGLLAWGGFELIRWFVRAANEPSSSSPRCNQAAGPVPPPPPPPPPTATQWWLYRNGQVVGPFSTAAVIDSIQRGESTRETQACRVGESQWLPLSGRPEFVNVRFS